jgi:hypothetical protein
MPLSVASGGRLHAVLSRRIRPSNSPALTLRVCDLNLQYLRERLSLRTQIQSRSARYPPHVSSEGQIMRTLPPKHPESHWTVEAFMPNARIALECVDEFMRKGYVESYLLPKKELTLPAHFWNELAALNIIAYWERTGAMANLPVSVPKYDDCLRALKAQLEVGPEHFLDGEPIGSLYEVVLRIYFFRRTYSPVLDCHFSPGWIDEESLVEGLAQLLWANRRSDVDMSVSLQPDSRRETVLELLDDTYTDFVATCGEDSHHEAAKIIAPSRAIERVVR